MVELSELSYRSNKLTAHFRGRHACFLILHKAGSCLFRLFFGASCFRGAPLYALALKAAVHFRKFCGFR